MKNKLITKQNKDFAIIMIVFVFTINIILEWDDFLEGIMTAFN